MTFLFNKKKMEDIMKYFYQAIKDNIKFNL